MKPSKIESNNTSVSDRLSHIENLAIVFLVFTSILFALAFSLQIVITKKVTDSFSTVQRNTVVLNKDTTPVALMDKDISIQISAILSSEVKAKDFYEFLNGITGEQAISEAITLNSLKYNVPLSLSLSMAWVESRFYAKAINGHQNTNGTKDWGLFQVNDVNIPDNWTLSDKLDVNKNSDLAIEHIAELRNLYDNNDVFVITAYNSGKTGIKDGVNYDALLRLSNVTAYMKVFKAQLIDYLVKH